jgi:predicted dehydrogenase/threonine dehydrogenase-like Zn-dependent dehydrogenase
MKQLAQYQDGRLELQDVAVPVPPPGGIVVRTTCTVISPGTEKMKVDQARMSLLEKARARPDQVRKVLDTARTLGWKAALEKVRNRLESPTPLGYSAAGVVVAVDEANPRFRIGDRVACGGAECAHHAEMLGVPDLLAAKIPDGVEDWQAAYTTLASISLEGVRQSGVRLGERVLVIGQGLIGLLATSLLRSAGARVMATDLNEGRLQVASAMGAERIVTTGVENAVREWTDGVGVDAVLVCIGGKGGAVSQTVINCLRDRGTMVIVGMHDAELPWKTAYMKDITVKYSRSYGPGRYDPQYEWGGRDYPIGQVRWTENRNFEACLELMRTGQLDLKPVTTKRIAFEEITSAYDSLGSDVGVVVSYDPISDFRFQIADLASPHANAENKSEIRNQKSKILDVIGAGNFARTMLLPHLKGKIPFGTIVNGTGLSARHVKEKFGFAAAETDASKATGGAVLIGTRHHLHAPQVISALKAGKQVFVEKPLCLTEAELAEIDAEMAQTAGSVMVGFNRRFAPATLEMKKRLDAAPGVKSLAYHVCAGVLAPDHWYANVEESGGRVLGEACHMLDLACYLLGTPKRVSAQPLGPDTAAAQVEFENGHTFQLIYTAEGDSSFPKETLRAFAPGLILDCENFMKLSIWKSRKQQTLKYTSKGHAEEMAAWSSYLNGEREHPLPYAQSRQSMALTFAVLRSIREARMICL